MRGHGWGLSRSTVQQHLVTAVLLVLSHSVLSNTWDQPLQFSQFSRARGPHDIGPTELSEGRVSDYQVDEQTHFEPSGLQLSKQGADAGQGVIAPDPHAPAAYNCLAVGHGIHEGQVGKRTRFQVFSRDMFGDAHECSPDFFAVRVLHLSTANDEDSVQCNENVGQRCTKCRGTTVCYEGSVNGACSYVYTPEASGFYRVIVMTPSSKGEGLVNIAGSPFRAHAEDGGYLLPGMSLSTYFLLFFVSIGGAVVVLVFFLSAAWNRWKSRQAPDEYEAEIARLQQIADDLEGMQGQREERQRLLAELDASGALQHAADFGPSTDSDRESLAEENQPWATHDYVAKAVQGVEAVRAAVSIFSPEKEKTGGMGIKEEGSLFEDLHMSSQPQVESFVIDDEDDDWGI